MRDDPRSLAFVPFADALRKRGQRADALAVLRAGLKHHPDHPPARVVLARLHLEGGNRPLAVAMLEEVVKADPENVAASSLLAELLLADGRLGEAQTLIERLRVQAPQDPTTASLARRAAPPLPHLHGTPGDPFDRVEWAEQLVARGDYPRATRAWQRIYAANARDPRARSRLIELSRALDGLGDVTGEAPRAGEPPRRIPGSGEALLAHLEAFDGPAPEGDDALRQWAAAFWSS